MRVGFVRNVGLGMVALVGLGLAGCDDSPTDFDPGETVDITTNPSEMVVPAGITTDLDSRTVNQGNGPSWEDIEATSCNPSIVSVEVSEDFEPTIQPPGQFDVTGGTTLGVSCIVLVGGGVTDSVPVTVVGDSLGITAADPDTTLLYAESPFGTSTTTTQLTPVLLSDQEETVSPFDPATDVTWASDDETILTVDATTGLVTAVGIGTATITGTWAGGGVTVASGLPISVEPAVVPTVASLSLIAGPVGTQVTVTGTDFVSISEVTVGGVAVPDFLEISKSPTSITFFMIGPDTLPGLKTATVRTGIDFPSLDTVTFTLAPTVGEPDAFATPRAAGAIPFSIVDNMTGSDLDDFFAFTLAAETSLDFSVEFTAGDIDVFILDAAEDDVCSAASSDNPEVIEGCVLAAGTYVVNLDNFGLNVVNYQLEGAITPP